MKQRSILFILFLLLSMVFCCGCTDQPSVNSEQSSKLALEISEEKSISTDNVSDFHMDSSDLVTVSTTETVEHVTGIFKGLEGNHTAVFSFDGVETAFHFEEPSVQKVLFEAVSDSSYTLSYFFDPSTGLYVIYEINES